MIMIKNIFCVLLHLFCLYTVALGQVGRVDSIAPVTVGGKLPRVLFDAKSKVLVDGVLSETSLAGDFDKLILIDFWASWCGSCLKKFPLLAKIQKQFPDDLKVVLVNSVGTGDSASSLAQKVRMGAAAGALGEIGLPFMVEDKMFLSAFPHRALPHYVWIVGGVVLGITQSDFLTEENVAVMVERGRKHMMIVNKKKARRAKD